MDERYSRQELLEQIGKEGQKKLLKSTVAIVGIGALGTVSAELLTRAGVNLILIDRDVVELSNLQRQSLYTELDLNRTKVNAAKQHLKKINSNTKITISSIHLNSKNVEILNGADLILDCTDNLQTRFLIDQFCLGNNKTWIYSAAIKTVGYVMPIFPKGPRLSDFLEQASLETCDTVGVLNSTTHLIASLQTTLTYKILLNKNTPSLLYHFDLWSMKLRTLKINKKKRQQNLKTKEDKIMQFCSSGKIQIQGPKIDFKETKKRWIKLGKVTEDNDTLKFKNIILFKDGRVLIKTKTKEEAQTIYSKYVGN